MNGAIFKKTSSSSDKQKRAPHTIQILGKTNENCINYLVIPSKIFPRQKSIIKNLDF
jgi:hypothetical protein